MGNLFGKTVPRDMEDLLDFLLKGIFNNIDLMDMYALTDPKQCPNYVIFGEKALEHYFIKLNLNLETNDKGFTYIRKLTTMQRDLARSPQHIDNCKKIAKFFELILRIFGSLYLSMKHTAKAGEVNFNKNTSPTAALSASKPWYRQLLSGGAIRMIGNTTITVDDNPSIDQVLGYIITKHFKGADSIDYIILGQGKSSVASPIKVDTATVFVRKQIESGSPTLERPLSRFARVGLPAPTPLPIFGARPPVEVGDETVSLKALARESGIRATAVIVSKQDPQIRVEYSFGKDRQYTYEFNMEITDGGSDDTFYCVLHNFSWLPPKERRTPEPSLIRADIARIRPKRFPLVLDGAGDVIIPVMSTRNKKTFYTGLIEFCRAIEKEVYRSEDLTSASYLEIWKYITTTDTRDLQPLIGVSPQNLFFNERTREESAIIITYKKENITLPNGSKLTVFLDCYITIREMEMKGSNYQYLLTIEAIHPRDAVNLEGIFTPLERAMSATFSTNSPEFTKPIFIRDSVTWNIPDYIRATADGTINRAISEAAMSYKKVHTEGYYKITGDKTPYSLRELQSFMGPNSPIPFCSAAAAELVSNLKQPFSSVCDPGFKFRRDGSLPKKRDDLLSSKGISTMAALMSAMETDASKISESAEWKKFVENIEAIQSAKRSNPCPSAGIIQLDESNGLSRVREIAAQLIARQEQHNSAALEIIWQLFDQNAAMGSGRKRGFLLNDRLFSEGFRRLEEIKNDCVNLLTNYYLDCDRTYLEGYNIILGESQEVPVVKESVVAVPKEVRPTAPAEEPETARVREEGEGNVPPTPAARGI